MNVSSKHLHCFRVSNIDARRRDPLGKLPLRQRFPGLAQRVEDDPEQLAVSRKALPRPAVGVFATEYRNCACIRPTTANI